MAGKLPSIHLYPGDWLRDPVAGCSLAAQGLWLRMMFLGHDSDRYGYLAVNGSPMQPDSIARRVGCSLVEFETLYRELEVSGVPSRTPDGLVFSRRMVRDSVDRNKASERKKKSRSCHATVTPNEDEDESEDESSCKSSSQKGSPEGKKSFSKPSLLDAIAYGVEIGMSKPSVERWHDHFESNGWRVGGKAQMKDWKAAMRNGKRNDQVFSGRSNPRPVPEKEYTGF